MPSSIPYDPSLTIGSVIALEKLQNIEAIAAAQAPADAAEAKMNSSISLKRSIDMTIQELLGMNVDPGDLVQKSTDLGKQIQTDAVAYATAKVAAETTVAPLRAKIIGVAAEYESPIDYNKSMIKQMPLSADSLSMDVQYFSFDQSSQSSQSHAATIAGYVSESLSIFGDTYSSQASSSAQAQMNNQHARHDIAGTLVISISCTHKNVNVFAPFILDVDKAVHTWNAMFPDSLIKTNDVASVAKIEAVSETKADKVINLISGAAYGSSFVGMVHILNASETDSSQSMESVAATLQEQFEVGAWFADESGGFGVSSSFSDSAKNLLSTQNIQSHCSAVTMGIIPSIKSNQVKMGVQQFADFDPEKDMQQLATLQGATADENNTVGSSATAARTGQQMIALQSNKISAVMSGLSQIDDGANNIIDINSLMVGMDDYISKCIEGGNNLGVPINYFLKPISQSMIARSWLAKYYPNKWNQAGSADDNKPSPDPAQ